MSAEPSNMRSSLPSAMTAGRVVDAYFIEHRGKLLDVAAFLDRVDRAAGEEGGEDFRVAALRRAVEILIDGGGDRTRRILELLSDTTTEPVAAAGAKGASGAVPPTLSEARS